MGRLDDSILGGYITSRTRVGCDHSYTVHETLSQSKVQKHVLLAQIRGETLTDYTKPDWYYCIVEDGSIFKYHPESHSFYGLDLERFVWVWDRSFVSIFYDTFLKFQEIDGFRDYFPHDPPAEK